MSSIGIGDKQEITTILNHNTTLRWYQEKLQKKTRCLLDLVIELAIQWRRGRGAPRNLSWGKELKSKFPFILLLYCSIFEIDK